MDKNKTLLQKLSEYIGNLEARSAYSTIREEEILTPVIKDLQTIANDYKDEEDKNETIVNNLKEIIDVLDNQIDLLYENLPVSTEECIQKNSTAMAYQKVLWTLEKILQGKKYNEDI